MTAVKVPTNIPGVPASPQVFVTDPSNRQVVLQHVPVPPGTYLQFSTPDFAPTATFVTIGPPGQNVVLLSQQNVIDLLPSLQAFANTGVLS